jgi:biopolymer transport protein ExbB
MKRLLALALTALLLPLSAHAWWDEAWTSRQKITLDTQAAGVAADATDVPVLLRLSTGNFDFLGINENGSDIRFVAEDDKTVLPHQIERLDTANELAFIWVKVPKLMAGNATQHIWLYSGHEAAPAAPAAPVFDAAQWAVYHLSDASGLPQDATAAGNHISAGVSTPVPSGLIAGAAKLSGDGGLKAGAPSLQALTAFTFSAWVRPQNTDGELMTYGGLNLSLVGGVPVLSAGGTTARAPAPLAPNGWTHIAVTQGATSAMLYVNGQPVGTLAQAFVPAAAISIGAGLVGEIDEIQVSGAERSAAWLMAQADSQGMASKLVKLGQAESAEGGGGESGYMMVILQNLTVDAWVVIVICGLMLVYAIYLMIFKGVLISRQERANPRFLEAFDQLTKQLPTLGTNAEAHGQRMDALSRQTGEYADSPIHRIFQVGVREIKFRFDQAAAAQKASGATAQGLPAISERALMAVRASLDAQLVRERQKLDSQMVLLTIAIAGGPFLGLLGTVVGVMITFGAVAVAGDVNVNAIAPGIAAALAATVAGLGVAIPALFGYNYLQTKIKSIAADMHVFVDEFVTKMSETYGD